MDTRARKARQVGVVSHHPARKALGFLICGLGCVLLLSGLFRQVFDASPNMRGVMLGAGLLLVLDRVMRATPTP